MRLVTVIATMAAFVVGCESPEPPPQRPWVIFGYAFNDDGDSASIRVETMAGAPPEGLRLANLGERRIDFEDVGFAVDTSSIEFTWPGREFSSCRLERLEPWTWEGACRSGSGERAIAFPSHYRPYAGGDLPPEPDDVAIVRAAAALLADSTSWNPVDDQDCEDDSEAGAYSLFCSLFVGQIETTGRYLHFRAATRAVRDVVLEYAPERIVSHPLRSFNNDERTDRADVLEVLRIASEDLAAAIAAGEDD